MIPVYSGFRKKEKNRRKVYSYKGRLVGNHFIIERCIFYNKKIPQRTLYEKFLSSKLTSTKPTLEDHLKELYLPLRTETIACLTESTDLSLVGYFPGHPFRYGPP